MIARRQATAGDEVRDGRGSDALRVWRFLRERSRHRARPDDVYISSYPRSGTTWMQLLVHLVRGGGMSFAHIADVVPWFERPLALGRATAADFARRPGPRSFKSHLPHAWLPRGARYLYIHRDGRDVLVSYYHFYRTHLGYGGSFDAFFERFLAGRLQYGSWFRHVADFARLAHRRDVCVLAYEQVKRDPERTIRALAAFCEVALDSARIREILELASFEAMKRREEKFDHATAEPSASAPRGQFVREGRVGAHRELLSPEQLERFERARHDRRSHLFSELQLAAFLH